MLPGGGAEFLFEKELAPDPYNPFSFPNAGTQKAHVVGIVRAVSVPSRGDLFQIVGAKHFMSRIPDLRQCGQQHSRQDRDDRDHDQKFDQGE